MPGGRKGGTLTSPARGTHAAATSVATFALVVCPRCYGPLVGEQGGRSCTLCAIRYAVWDGILELEQGEGVDLRIGHQLLDIHALRKDGLYFGKAVTGAVERAARVHSVAFVDFHAALLRPYLRGAVVVDLGCGQLPYVDALAGNGIREYYAFDLSAESLRVARENARVDFPLHLVMGGVRNVPLPDGAVDAVISSEVIEHVDDPASYLAEIHRVLRPGGHVSLSTPCASLYLVPSAVLPLLRRPGRVRRWWKEVNPHTCWSEALAWHPALRPSVLRQWMKGAGFRVLRHETRLWYYGSYLRPAWRGFAALERLGWRQAGAVFESYLRFTDRMLSSGLPLIRWAGIRQFVLCEKQA